MVELCANLKGKHFVMQLWKTLCEVLNYQRLSHFLLLFLKAKLKQEEINVLYGSVGGFFLWAFVGFSVGPLMELISLAVQFFSYCIFKLCCTVPCEHRVLPDE